MLSASSSLSSIPSCVDVVIIGAGAAGLMCAAQASQRHKSVIVLDHSPKIGEKIRISGGGRCNFTNLHTKPSHFISQNPSFCVSALSRFTPHDFIALVEKHNIAYHEKTLGQLFCDDKAQQIIDMLVNECHPEFSRFLLGVRVHSVTKNDNRFVVITSNGDISCTQLVIATGGLSIPKMGATGFGYDIAKQFGHSVVPPTPALVPFTLTPEDLSPLAALAGIAGEAIVSTENTHFREGFLFTHRGISGPSVLQISSYWKPPQPVYIRFLPHQDLAALLIAAKKQNSKQELVSALAQLLPKRLATYFVSTLWPDAAHARLADLADKKISAFAQSVMTWHLYPAGTEGFKTAEVTKGGVDTHTLSSKTMMSTLVEGLYFIGEVVDVTGHLGGFNFQWAWSSGYVAGQHV